VEFNKNKHVTMYITVGSPIITGSGV